MWGKLLAGAGVLALAGFALWMFGNARYQQGYLARQTIEDAAALKNAGTVADKRVADEQRVTKAVTDWAQRAADLKPIILTNNEKVTTYAQSPAGRVVCRDPQRVRDLDALDAALWPAAASAGNAAGSSGTVPANTAAPPAGR